MGERGWLDIGLSMAPIVLFILLLVGGKRTSACAAAVGLLTAVGVAVFRFSTDGTALFWEGVKGTWNAFTIFTVILSAMFIYELLRRAGMFERIRREMEAVIGDDLLRVLFIGWAFTSFLQSITGFGVPVAVAAPILVSFGISPIRSVAICILGHAWGGTFGTLAMAWDSMLIQVPQAAEDPNLALYTCLMLWVYNFICGLAIGVFYKGKGLRMGDVGTIVLISGLQGGGQLLFAQWNTSTACFLASMLSMGGILAVNALLYKKKADRPKGEKECVGLPMVFPFLVLTVLVVVCLFFRPVYQYLSQWVVGPLIPGPGGTRQIYSPMSVLTHSGTLLLVTGGITGIYYKWKGHLDAAALIGSARDAMGKALSSILPIFLLIVMSKVMDGSGQIYALANGISGVLGRAYPLVAPSVGILGAFISSSNMSSNILFSGFQNHVAQLIGADGAAILAAQTVGGSVGNLTATSNMVLGLATTGEPGKEGALMHLMIPIALGCGLLLGVITWVLAV